MKALKVILPIVVIAALGVGGFFAYQNFSTTTPTNTEEVAETDEAQTIQTDDQFNYILVGFMKEYSEARLNFSQIFDANIEEIGADEWKKMIDENTKQWEKIEFYGGLLEEYLKDNQDLAFLINTAYAQSNIEDLLNPPEGENDIENIINSTYKKESDPTEGTNLMVDFEDTSGELAGNYEGLDKFEISKQGEILKIARDAEKGRILLDIVEKMGAKDTKEAQKWLQEANNLYVSLQNDSIQLNKEGAVLAEKVRNTAIFTGIAVLSVHGLLVSGATLVGSSGTGLAHIAGSAGFSLGSIEFLLTTGKHGSILINNKKAEEFFVGQENELKSYFEDVKLAVAAYNLTKFKLPNPKDFKIEDIPALIENIKAVKDLHKKIKLLIEKPDEYILTGNYETTYSITDDYTGGTGTGTLKFTVQDDGFATGTVTFNFSGTVGPSNITSSFDAKVSGVIDPITEMLNLKGKYTGQSQSETNGYTGNTVENGTIDINALFSNNEFAGTIKIVNDVALSGLGQWSASKK